MGKEKEMPQGYGLLWVIVVILVIMVGVSHFVYLVGQGRWECTEYKTYCSECVNEGVGITNTSGLEIKIKWKVENPNMCYCVGYTTECVNEVWTRK